MSVLNVDYRFKILSVDQEQSTMLVEFDPLDDDCLPVTLNCLFHLDSTDNHPSYANVESIPLVEGTVIFFQLGISACFAIF